MRERLLLPLVCVATDSLVCAASSVSWLAGEPTDNGCRALARCPLSGGCPSGWAAAAHRANTAAVHLGGPRQRGAMRPHARGLAEKRCLFKNARGHKLHSARELKEKAEKSRRRGEGLRGVSTVDEDALYSREERVVLCACSANCEIC